MRFFQAAVRAHESIARAYQGNAPLAAELWNGLAGHGEPVDETFAAAVADTVPAEHAALVAASEVAAVYAFGRHWEAFHQATPRVTARTTPRELRDIARDAWETFGERATATEELALGFGWDLSEAWTVLQDVQVSTKSFEDVARVARLAGRMYAAMRGNSASRVLGVPAEMHDVEQGSHLGRLLPSELVQLFDEDLETEALRRFVENQALQYAMRGTTTASKGPLVMALDESGSMHGARREWSKAAAIALMRVAFEEKRPVAVVHYSTSTVVRHIAPGDARAVVNMIRHFLNGGTAIGMALQVAVGTVQELTKKGKPGADIVIVTDGVDNNTASQRHALADAKALGARLWTVAIECTIPEGQPLRDSAAHYIEIGDTSLSDPTSAVPLGAAATGAKGPPPTKAWPKARPAPDPTDYEARRAAEAARLTANALGHRSQCGHPDHVHDATCGRSPQWGPRR